jgi:hypothetical protein
VPIGGDPPLPADVIPPPPAPPLPPPSPDQSDPMVEDDSQVPVGFRPLGVRGNASHAFFVTTYGKVTYYRSNRSIEAVCRFPGHGDCRVTRTCKPPTGARLISRRHQGRSAACLVAWCETASAEQASASDHKRVMPSFFARRAVRDRLKTGGPNAIALLGGERDKFAYEADSEPSEFDPFEI